MNHVTVEFKRLIDRLTWSVAGLRATWESEKSFRQWGYLNVLSMIGLSVVEFTLIEIIITLCLGLLVLICELFNTALEATVDYVSTEKHPLAKLAKDTSSAAVFLAAITWCTAWILLLIPS